MDRSAVKIMVVNDKMDIRAIIRDYLRIEGYTSLNISENGQAALKKAQTDPPDLIIADYDLPGLTGLELLKAVRHDKNLSETIFILISAETEQKYVAQAAEYKVSAYIVKPFSHQTLADKVNFLLDRKVNPSETAERYQEANRLALAGDLQGALEKYQQALRETQKSMAALYYKVGQVHEKMDKFTEAELDYQQAAQVSVQYVDAYDALGALSLREDRHDDALQYLKRSTGISPLNAKRQISLGEAMLNTGDFVGAEKAFKLALSLDSTQTHVLNRLGISLRRQGKLEEAEQFLLRAVEAAVDDEHLYYNLSRIYLDRGDKKAALINLDKALAVKPEFTEARTLMEQIRSTQ